MMASEMTERNPGQVGVRELRQNLSVYLDRVKAGETLEVTERGVPVAVLRPIAREMTPLERLIAAGRATRPTGHLRDLPPPPDLKLEKPLSQILAEMRDAERY
jgi:prevent-host-death family protein